ncbi:MAG: hypothetical protein ACR2GK_09920 [Gemmatimonadaceae bacterium]
MMTKRLAVSGLVIATTAIVAAYALVFIQGAATNAGAMLMVFGIATMAVSLMTLGAVRTGENLGVLAFAFVFVFAVLMIGFALALLLPAGDNAATRLFFGLPPRAAIVVYGIGLLPVFVLPLIYAATFEERTLSEADLERIKAAAAAHAETQKTGGDR